MNRKQTIAIAMMSASTVAFGQAFAQTNNNVNDVNNSQTNWAKTRALLNADLNGVTEEVTATAAAISNSFSAELGGKSSVTNTQVTGLDEDGELVADQDPVAELNLNATNQVGSINATAAAIGNSASITIDGTVAGTNPTSDIFNSQQAFTSAYSDVNASVAGVDDEVALTSAAINNSLSVDGTGDTSVNNFQDSWRNATSDLDLEASDTLGSIRATSAAIGNSASMNLDSPGGFSSVNNRQLTHWGEFTSNVNLNGQNVEATDASQAAITSTSAAIANSVSVEGAGSLEATNEQFFRGDARAYSTVDLDNIQGAVDITTAAIGNSASFDMTDADFVSITNDQRSMYDPTATSTVNLGQIRGDVSVTSAALANSLSVSTLPSTASLDVQTKQENGAYTEALVDASVGNIVGNASFTAAAIGNSVSINNLPN